MSMLLDIFPDFNFDPNAREDEHYESLQSSIEFRYMITL